jgi:hypothetical protein
MPWYELVSVPHVISWTVQVFCIFLFYQFSALHIQTGCTELSFSKSTYIFFLISNSYSLKVQSGAILVHMKHTRKPLKYRKIRTKLQKIWNKQTIPHYYPCIKGIGTTSSSTLISQSCDLQSFLCSVHFKYTTLNRSQPPHFQSNTVSQLSPPIHQQLSHPSRHNPCNTKQLEKQTP